MKKISQTKCTFNDFNHAKSAFWYISLKQYYIKSDTVLDRTYYSHGRV